MLETAWSMLIINFGGWSQKARDIFIPPLPFICYSQQQRNCRIQVNQGRKGKNQLPHFLFSLVVFLMPSTYCLKQGMHFPSSNPVWYYFLLFVTKHYLREKFYANLYLQCKFYASEASWWSSKVNLIAKNTEGNLLKRGQPQTLEI